MEGGKGRGDAEKKRGPETKFQKKKKKAQRWNREGGVGASADQEIAGCGRGDAVPGKKSRADRVEKSGHREKKCNSSNGERNAEKPAPLKGARGQWGRKRRKKNLKWGQKSASDDSKRFCAKEGSICAKFQKLHKEAWGN